jgi:DNA invertase Pin-like site-specific DNA recombinase
MGFAKAVPVARTEREIEVNRVMGTHTSGRLIFQIIGKMAEFERADVQERIRAGLRKTQRDSQRLGRPRLAVDASWNKS